METDANSVIREVAHSRIRSEKLDLLTLLDAAVGGTTGSTLVDSVPATRETAYRRLNQFVDIGFVTDDGSDGFQTTRAGELAADAYRRVADRLDEEDILFLAGTQSRQELLRQFVEAPAHKATLAADDEFPSRTTIHRATNDFEERGWVEQTADGALQATPAAVRACDEYEWLRVAIEQAITKADCLDRLEPWATPPLTLLAETELVRERNDDPYALLQAAVEAANIRTGSLSHVRSVTPLFDPVIFGVFGEYVDRGTQFEIVFDQQAYEQLTQPSNLHFLAGAVVAPNVDVRIHPKPLYTGLGLYDDSVLLGGSTRFDRDVGVTSNSESAHRWATGVFEDIWAESATPTQRLRSWLGESRPAAGD